MLAQSRNRKVHSIAYPITTRCIGMLVALATMSISSDLHAQFGGPGGGIFLGNQGVVGGVEINTDGVLGKNATRLNEDIKSKIEQGLKSVASDINQPGLRMISLRQLESEMVRHKKEGKPFSPSIRYMAGLQRIEFVMITPEQDDIIIGGPGEGFKANDDGQIVGATSGMPVIHLEDFLIAMRFVDNARRDSGISVSIDPTEEGIESIRRILQQMNAGNFDQSAAQALEQAGGPQKISLTGVPKDSRYSQILVSADYRMKSLAMGLEKSPEFLPSILQMAQRRDSASKKMTPRFWMECDYHPVAVSDDGRIWKLSGTGVRAKSEEEFVAADGQRSSRRPDKLARKWADTMSDRYEELSKQQPVFRELRNLMDLSVVAAIIAKEDLIEKTKLPLPSILALDTVATPTWNVPKSVPTQCSFVRLSNSLMVTTSGGVLVDSWSVAANTKVDPKLASIAASAIDSRGDRWWWNAGG